MPRSGAIALALAFTLFVPDYAAAVEEGTSDLTGGDNGYDDVDLSVESSGDKDQGHVDLSIDGADGASGDDKGDGHVDLSIDGSDSTTGGDMCDGDVDSSVDTAGGRENGHVDLRIDPAAAYTVAADLVPGAQGAEICGFEGDRENGHVDFRIVIHPDGRIEVNGQGLAVCDPAEGCRISLAWWPGTGALAVQAEDASGGVCAAQYVMDGAPDGICISAAEVRSLSVQRQ